MAAVRNGLGLTAEEFAARFRVPLDELLAWEEGRAEPNPVTSAYLQAIAGDADAIHRALRAGSRPSV
jgi:putative transcriptional regulator